MPLAVLYDIHGNLPALDAVLRELEGERVDAIVVGGDVMPGPLPGEVLRRLRALTIPVHWIRGNGDREAIAHRANGGTATLPPGVRESLRWAGMQLTDEEAGFVASWPLTLRLTTDDGTDVVFCHATPRNDTDIFLADTDERALMPLFSQVGAPLVICGHTHMRFDRMIGTVRVVNAGSVGMPFDEAGAHWLLVGATVERRLTTYDREAAAQRLRASAYPGHDFADRYVLAEPDSAAAIAMMRGAALR